MPFCSRRTWKTPSGFTTWPTPGCYDDGVVLPRFQSRYPDRKTAGVYHDNHPDTAADTGLLLSRHSQGFSSRLYADQIGAHPPQPCCSGLVVAAFGGSLIREQDIG